MSIFYTDEYFHPNYKYNKNKHHSSKGIDANLFFSFKNGLTLKRDFYSFPSNLHFDEVCLNLYHIVTFNIYDSDQKHIFEPNGFNYQGNWGISLKMSDNNWIHFEDLCFWDEGLYNITHHTRMAVTETGFVLKNLQATNRILKFSGKKISQLEIDFITSNLLMTVQNHHYKYPFRLNFTLNPESIPSRFLKTALEQNLIIECDYDDQIWRRNYFDFDVKMPI